MRSRSRLIATVASLLACVAMVGTGFASWVILSEKTDEATGNVKAEAVSEGELTFSVAAASKTANIFFGGPATQEAPNAWISSNGDEGTEQLSVNFVLEVTGKVDKVVIAVEETGLDAAITAGYITNASFALSAVHNNNDNGTDVQTTAQASYDAGSKTVTFGGGGYEFENGQIVITMSYQWGAAFDNENPYSFFNDKTRSEQVQDDPQYASLQTYYSEYATQTWADAAKGVLGALYDDLGTTSGISITVTFTATQAA